MTEPTLPDPRLVRDLRETLAWAERVHATALQLAVAWVVSQPPSQLAYVGAEATHPEVERGDVRGYLRAALGALGYGVGAPGGDSADRP